MSVAELVRLQLLRELDGFVREVDACPDDLVLWQVAPGVTNSVGTLALHVSGNLQHFVGHLMGRSGYVRNREREFSQREGSRAEVIATLQAARDAVDYTLRTMTSEALSAEMSGLLPDRTVPTATFLVHLGAHLAFHLGQAGYVRRVVTATNTSTAPLPLIAMLSRAE